MPKKIKIVYYTDSKIVGGAEKFLFLLLKNLDRQKFHPYLICPDDEIHKQWAKSIENLGVNVLPYATRNVFNPIKLIKLYKNIKIIDPDIIHFQFWSPYSCGAGLFCSSMVKRPITVSTEHSFVPLSEAEWYLKPIKSIYQLWRKNLIDYPTTVSTASKIMMQRDQFFGDKKIYVIHNGIEISSAHQQRTPGLALRLKGKVNLAFVARLEEGKGHQTLIEAIRKLDGKDRRIIQVHFIGGGSLQDSLQKITTSRKLNKQIIFWGERKDVRKILPYFDFFVFPSYTENFPFAILEAMAAGLAIVASDVGGIKEALINQKGGYLIPPRDSRLLADKMTLLIKNPYLRKKMGDFNRKFVQSRFSDKIMAKQTEKVYAYALNKIA